MTASELALQIDAAEREIHSAPFRPVSEVPTVVSRAVDLLQKVHANAVTCPSEERAYLLARLVGFQSKLNLFAQVMARSFHIFQGYSRRAGVSSDEYRPRGAAPEPREPAFVNLSM